MNLLSLVLLVSTAAPAAQKAIDPEAAAASTLGATVTPQVCVIDGEGRLAYRGAISPGGAEDSRRNLVLEAVRALQAGKAIAEPEVAAHGCAVHRTQPRGLAAKDADEDAAAKDLYEQARSAARFGHASDASERLTRSVAAGLPRPGWILTDPAFTDTWRDADSRLAIRRLLRTHAPTGQLTMGQYTSTCASRQPPASHPAR